MGEARQRPLILAFLHLPSSLAVVVLFAGLSDPQGDVLFIVCSRVVCAIGDQSRAAILLKASLRIIHALSTHVYATAFLACGLGREDWIK